jgi:SAM-dependent methyltransferase
MTEFSDDQFSSAYPDGIEHHYWNQARNHIIVSTLKRAGLKGAHILEIGCGTGVVLRALWDDNMTAYGVDLSPGDAPADLKNYLYYGISFTALPPELIASVEVILLCDVIEHIEDDKDFLLQIQHTFPKLTHIVATIPACQELWSNYDEHYRHFRRYDQVRVQSLTSANLDFSSVAYFFHGLYLPARLLLLLGKKRSTTITPPQGALALFIHNIIARVFILESRLLPTKLPGTSIIFVGKKR